TLVRDRGLRAVCRWETGRRDAAVADLQILIDAKPAGVDLDELRKMQAYFRTNRPPTRYIVRLGANSAPKCRSGKMEKLATRGPSVSYKCAASGRARDAESAI